jgi:hypothetical protein
MLINIEFCVVLNCSVFDPDRPVVMLPEDHPKNSTVNAGQTVRFACKATGNPPTKYYVWRFKGAKMPGKMFPTYTKSHVNRDDEGRYSCSGVNSRGEGPRVYVYLFIKSMYLV